MSEKFLITEAVSYIDDRLLAKYFSMKEKKAKKKPKSKFGNFKNLTIAAACFLAVFAAVSLTLKLTGSNSPSPVTLRYDSISQVEAELGITTLFPDSEFGDTEITVSFESDKNGNAVKDSPLQLLIRQSRSNGNGYDKINYYLIFGKTDVGDSYIGGYEEQNRTKFINGVTVHYSEIFDGSNHTQAKFLYQNNLYVIDIVSKEKIDLDFYLSEILQ